MKHQNCSWILLIVFMFVMLLYLIGISIYIFIKIDHIEHCIENLNKKTVLDPQSTQSQNIDKLFEYIGVILFRQNETINLINNNNDDILSKIQMNSQDLTAYIDDVKDSQVNNDTLSSIITGISTQLTNLANDNTLSLTTLTILQQRLYNLTKQFREHVGFVGDYCTDPLSFIPAQNESCGQCTFTLDLDTQLSNTTFLIKPVIYIVNNIQATPIIDLTYSDMLLNGTVTLRNVLDSLDSDQMNFSNSLNEIIDSITNLTTSLNSTNNLVSQLMASVTCLTGVISDSGPAFSINFLYSNNITNIIQTNNQGFFLNSNLIPSCDLNAVLSIAISQPDPNSASYITTITGFLTFVVNNMPSGDSLVIKCFENPFVFSIFSGQNIPQNYFKFINFTSPNYNTFQSFLYNSFNPDFSGTFTKNVTQCDYLNSPINSAFKIISPSFGETNVLQIFFPINNNASNIFINGESSFSYQFYFNFGT